MIRYRISAVKGRYRYYYSKIFKTKTKAKQAIKKLSRLGYPLKSPVIAIARNKKYY